MIAIGKHVLVKPDEAKTKSGLIYIPEVAQKKVVMGTIVKVGQSVDGPLLAGHRVMYETGTKMEGGILGIHEDNILLIL